MFLDARDLQSDAAIECDVCIMGAGAAGITLARELSSSPIKVCVLESGGFDIEEGTQALYKGEIAGTHYPDLDVARLRMFGGSTNHWDGNCSALEDLDFGERPWVRYSGWPIEKAELDRFYPRAQAYCQLGPYRYDAAYWMDRAHAPALALDPARAVTAMAQLSPPTRFGDAYRDDLKSAGNVTVVLHANVIDIRTSDADGGRIASVTVAILGGSRFSVSARHFVLALGGIENARVLLLSSSQQPAGIGNQNDQVGRYFMEHPIVDGAVFQPSSQRLDLRLYGELKIDGRDITAFLQLAEPALRQYGLMNVRAPLAPKTRYQAAPGVEGYHELAEAAGGGPMPDNVWTDVAEVIEDIDMVVEGGARKYLDRRLFPSANDLGYYGLDTMMEQPPDPANRVTLSQRHDAFGQRQARLEWRIDANTQENLWRCYEVIGAALGRAGVGRLRSWREHHVRLFGTKRLNYGFHHIGTTRMSANPRLGVVDADCRVHGLENLYVAGSSVFPTGGHVPPTLTIVALAIRLAEHLKSKAVERP
ncbi:MAG TPA: GMC family oxidoreductase [Candidatus Cybelea sp.]|nr:GMC family oxidoreductase [Candidatus Cybelea sp.]